MSAKFMGMRHTSAVAAGTVALLAIAGCGGNSPNGNGAAVKKGGTLVIGILAPFTGPNAQAGTDLMKGVDLAVKDINAAGGAGGMKVKVVTGDTVSDPTDAVSAASKLINADHVQILIGPRTITGPAVLPISMRAKVPEFIVGGSTVLDKNTDPFFWRTSPSDSQQGIAMAAYAAKKGYKRAALAFEQQPAAQTLKKPIQDAFTKHGGKIITTVDLTPSQSSYRSEIQKLYAGKPDVIFTQVSAQTASAFFPQVKQLEGLTTPYIGTNVMDSSDFFKAVGPEIAQSPIYAAQASSSGGAGYQHFAAEYKQAYGTSQTANLSPDMYDAVILAALAVDKSKVTSGQAVANAVTQVSNAPGMSVTNYADAAKALKAGKQINYDGASGNDDFDKYHNVFGPYEILHFTAAGTTKRIAELPASLLAGY